eukprot:11702538-Ditylum_brightwellii.AAC.1
MEEDQWLAEAPFVFQKMEEEGRPKPIVRSALQTHLQSNMSDDLPAIIFVSELLVGDIHDVNLGWGSNLSYDNCHRGLSIFAVAHKTKKEIARLEKKQEHVEKS